MVVKIAYTPGAKTPVYSGVSTELNNRGIMVPNPYMAVCPANFLAVDNGQRYLI